MNKSVLIDLIISVQKDNNATISNINALSCLNEKILIFLLAGVIKNIDKQNNIISPVASDGIGEIGINTNKKEFIAIINKNKIISIALSKLKKETLVKFSNFDK